MEEGETLKFTMVIKEGLKTLATVNGNPVADASISVADLNQVLETEKFLERLFGLRFHINQGH